MVLQLGSHWLYHSYFFRNLFCRKTVFWRLCHTLHTLMVNMFVLRSILELHYFLHTANFFWQNSKWMPVVRAPLKRDAACLKGIHSPLRRPVASSAGDDGASGNSENPPAFPGQAQALNSGKRNSISQLLPQGTVGRTDACAEKWRRCFAAAAVGPRALLYACSLRDSKNPSQTLEPNTLQQGLPFRGKPPCFFGARSSGSFLPKFTSKGVWRDLREAEGCRLPGCVGRWHTPPLL